MEPTNISLSMGNVEITIELNDSTEAKLVSKKIISELKDEDKPKYSVSIGSEVAKFESVQLIKKSGGQ